jgi:hypothetical protein
LRREFRKTLVVIQPRFGLLCSVEHKGAGILGANIEQLLKGAGHEYQKISSGHRSGRCRYSRTVFGTAAVLWR